jgi:hypothetical protein
MVFPGIIGVPCLYYSLYWETIFGAIMLVAVLIINITGSLQTAAGVVSTIFAIA